MKKNKARDLELNKNEFEKHIEYLKERIIYDKIHDIGKTENDSRTLDNFFKEMDKYGLNYKEKQALVKYFSSESYVINELLRTKTQDFEEYQEIIDNLDNSLKKLPSYQGIVYRGVNIDDQRTSLEEILNVFNNPERIGSFRSYTSSSLDLYDSDFRLQFIINSKTAKITFDFKGEGKEELLFQRNTFFKLIDYSVQNISDRDYMFVYLEEINDKNIINA